MWRQLLSFFCLLTLAAAAESPAEVRKVLQGYYDAMNAAAVRRDVEASFAYSAKDFSSTTSDGQRFTLDESKRMLKSIVNKASELKASARIMSITVKGNRARVRVDETFSAKLRGFWPGQKTSINSHDTCDDEWIRTPAGWRLQSSTGLSLNMTYGDKKIVKESSYLRVLQQKGQATDMETAIVRFAGKSGETVDLVAAVHMAEPAYYARLDKEFKGYDAVLYELVAPDQAVPVPNEEADNPLSAFQLALTDLLGLTFQLNEVDYGARNFVHADLTPEELNASMTRRGESVQSMMLQMIKAGLANPALINPRDEIALNLALPSIMAKGPSPAQRALLRRVLAQSFREVEKVTQGLTGPKGSTLISVRNQRALEVLKKVVRKGRKRIAIFYGAAHMPDFEKRMLKQGYTKQETRYLKAWDLRDPK